MKKCAICNTEYDSRIEYCFRDGSPLGDALKGHTPKLVPNQLSNISDPVDMMQTLDNISIDDLLQIGGAGGFQGFGEFAPIEAPASKEGDTLSMSRSSIQDMLTQGTNLDPSPSQSSTAENVQSSSTSDEQIEDVEDILGSFGRDVGAHLDDTLDGVQIGQLMEDATLDMMGTNEILPGDTLDVMVDDFDVPEMREADLGKVEQGFLDDLDQWEASGPIMQEAARQALEQHNKHSGGGSVGTSTSTSSNTVESSSEAKESSKVPLIMGALVVLIAGGVFLFGGGTDSVEPSNEDKTLVDTDTPRLVVPPVQTVNHDSDSVKETDNADNADKDAKGDTDLQENDSMQGSGNSDSTKGVDASKTEPNPGIELEPTEQEKSDAGVNKGVGTVEASNAVPVSTDSKTTATPKAPVQSAPSAPSTPKKASTPKKKKSVPKKPKSKPKPIPKKDPAVDNGWEPVQSGGWGASTCGVQVSSNVSSAQVFVDGIKKGSVGKNLTVDCGKHKLEVRADGYTSKSRSIDLTGDASFTMELSK